MDSEHVEIECKSVKQPLIFPILQLEWHPLSSNHLCILNVKRLDFYNFGRESKFWENWIDSNNCVSFCFGGHDAWNAFTIMMMDRSGKISLFCPIIPNGTEILKEHFDQISNQIPQTQLSRQNTEIILKNFKLDANTSNYYYLPSENPSHLRPQLVGTSHSKVALPAQVLALQLQSFPQGFPFLHCIRLYSSGHIDALVGLSPSEPCWGVSRPGQTETESFQFAVLNRSLLAPWSDPITGSGYIEIIKNDNDPRGILIRNGKDAYAAQMCGFGSLLQLINCGPSLSSLQLHESKEKDDVSKFAKEAFIATLENPWMNNLLSFESDSKGNVEVPVDSSKGVGISDFGLGSVVLGLSSQFSLSFAETKNIEGFCGQKIVIPESSQTSIAVSEILELREAPLPKMYSTLAKKVSDLKLRIQSATDEMSLDELSISLAQVIDEVSSISSLEEIASLKNSQVEIETMTGRVRRMDEFLSQSIQLTPQEVEIAMFLQSVQENLPVFHDSLKHVFEFSNMLFFGSDSFCMQFKDSLEELKYENVTPEQFDVGLESKEEISSCQKALNDL